MKERVQAERLRRRKEAREEAHRQRQNNDRTMIEFQPDAVEIEKTSVPGGARWTLYVTAALIVTAVTWAYWAQVDKVVVAEGKLVTTMPPIVIQTASTAPIGAIKVQFGDRVTAGQVLATLDPTFSDADLKQNENKKKSLAAHYARLKAEHERVEFSVVGFEDDSNYQMQNQVYLERQNEYRAKLQELKSQQDKVIVEQTSNEMDILKKTKELGIYVELEKTFRRLQKNGSSSEVDVLSRKLTRSQAETELSMAKNNRGKLDSELDAVRKRATAFIAGWRAQVAGDLLETGQKLSEMEQELSKSRRMTELVELRVPEDLPFKEFVVLEVADRTVGSVVQPGEALFRLIPTDVPLEAQVEISGRDIALIAEGKEVAVKLNSFPYQKHGTITGTVRKISEGVFEKENAAIGLPSAYYRGLIALPETVKMDNVPENFRLMPGMAATAEIKIGKRRVIEYILYPLLKGFESMREP